MKPSRREEEIARDSELLRPALSLLQDVRRPDSLSAASLWEAAAAAPASRPLRWLRPAGALAAAFVVVVGAVLALRQGENWLPGVPPSSSAAQEAAPETAAAPSLAVADEAGGAAVAGAPQVLPAESYSQAIDFIGAIVGRQSAATRELEKAALGEFGGQDGAGPDGGQGDGTDKGAGADEAQAGGPAGRAAVPQAAAAGPAASATNVQTPGIDEADLLKTDGQYLYYLGYATQERPRTTVYIVRADTMEVASALELGEDSYAGQLFVEGERLAVISASNLTMRPATGLDNPGPANVSTDVRIYDIADRAAPRLLRTWAQQGEYVGARLQDGTLYLVSNRYTDTSPWLAEGAPPTTVQAVPQVYDSLTGGQRLLATGDLLLASDAAATSWAVVSALPLDGQGQGTHTQAVLGGAQLVYQSAQSLYVASPAQSAAVGGGGEAPAASPREGGQDTIGGNIAAVSSTRILRFSLAGGQPRFVAAATVEGTLESQFSLDEYGGNLRVATTTQDEEGETENHLFVLGEAMEARAALHALAPGERILAVRYLGDTAYLVTFREADPLFAVDLSDPDNIRVLGQVEVPGFSDYLHPLGDGLLLGLGQEMAPLPDGGVVNNGLKLSLFDVSNPRQPREIDAVHVGDHGSHSPALGDHRAFLAGEGGLFGFPADIYQNAGGPAPGWEGGHAFSGFLLYRVAGKKIEEAGRVSHCADIAQFDYNRDMVNRGAIIGDTLYTAANARLVATDLNTLKTTGAVALD